jgi:transposase
VVRPTLRPKPRRMPRRLISTVKTDRNDARGIAQLMRLGWFRPVHCKSVEAQEIRALLTARKLVQSRLYD